MVRFDSWRAVGPGNRNLATKSTLGGRAIWRAVTCVKLEQASKAAIWTPTRRETGEGSKEREMPGAGARRRQDRRCLPDRSHPGCLLTLSGLHWGILDRYHEDHCTGFGKFGSKTTPLAGRPLTVLSTHAFILCFNPAKSLTSGGAQTSTVSIHPW